MCVCVRSVSVYVCLGVLACMCVCIGVSACKCVRVYVCLGVSVHTCTCVCVCVGTIRYAHTVMIHALWMCTCRQPGKVIELIYRVAIICNMMPSQDLPKT